MRVTLCLPALFAAALVACGTVSEQTAAPAPAPVAEAPAPVADPAPAPGPVAQVAPAPAQPAMAAPKKRAVKAVKVARRAVAAPAAVPAKPAGPTEQEIAAALAYVDEALGRYMLEQARFTAPATLKRDATGNATLEFASGSGFEQARQAIAANSQVQKAGLQITGRVQGHLAGDNIGVKATSPETQELSGGTTSQWKWQLLPSAEGRAKVHLVISVDTVLAGSATPRSVHTLDKEIIIEAAAPPPPQGGFLGNNWWWMLILLVVAIAGGWFVRRKAA